MDEMRQGIGLRAYAQSDPLVAYKREAHDMWGQLLENIRSQVARQMFHARIVTRGAQQTPAPPRNIREHGPGESGSERDGAGAASRSATVKKVGRNQPCPCGSGKKYKRCHGIAA
jgi:preprotein translocase subunit SecA